MTTTRKEKRSSLRPLAHAELASVTGGIIGILTYSSTTVGNPEESTTFTGGVYQSLPAIQR